VPDYSEHNVYLTTSVPVAENYATRAAIDDRSLAVVLRVTVHDLAKLILDEDNANWMDVINPKGEVVDVHFRHSHWREWPNANDIKARFQSKIFKGLHKSATVAYKGRILPKDVSVEFTYKPEKMSKDPD